MKQRNNTNAPAKREFDEVIRCRVPSAFKRRLAKLCDERMISESVLMRRSLANAMAEMEKGTLNLGSI